MKGGKGRPTSKGREGKAGGDRGEKGTKGKGRAGKGGEGRGERWEVEGKAGGEGCPFFLLSRPGNPICVPARHCPYKAMYQI